MNRMKQVDLWGFQSWIWGSHCLWYLLSSLLLAEMECNLQWEEWVPGYSHCLLQFHRAACKQGKDCSRRQPNLEISMLDRNRLSSNHTLVSAHRRASTQACMHTDTHTQNTTIPSPFKALPTPKVNSWWVDNKSICCGLIVWVSYLILPITGVIWKTGRCSRFHYGSHLGTVSLRRICFYCPKLLYLRACWCVSLRLDFSWTKWSMWVPFSLLLPGLKLV